EATGAAGVIDRGDRGDLAVGDAEDHRHARLTLGQSAADVEGQGAYVAPTGAVGAVRDQVDAVHDACLFGEAARGREQLGDPDLLALLLRLPRPLHRVLARRAQVGGLGLQPRGQLRDDVALPGQVGESRDTGQRLDATVAGTDRGLPGDHDG